MWVTWTWVSATRMLSTSRNDPLEELQVKSWALLGATTKQQGGFGGRYSAEVRLACSLQYPILYNHHQESLLNRVKLKVWALQIVAISSTPTSENNIVFGHWLECVQVGLTLLTYSPDIYYFCSYLHLEPRYKRAKDSTVCLRIKIPSPPFT